VRALLALGIACVSVVAACDRAESKSANNTKVNDRDLNSDTATPTTQGNAESEVKITADIRRSVVGDDSLGFDAKNVKIVTVGTKVTLRGPVASAEEKTAINGYAKKAAGVTDVDDQIEIKK